jgi:hypothetical protein
MSIESANGEKPQKLNEKQRFIDFRIFVISNNWTQLGQNDSNWPTPQYGVSPISN